MPTPAFFAGLWTLRGYPSPQDEWSNEEKFAEIKRRGFQGVGGRFLPEAPELCRHHGLDYVLYIDAGPEDFEEQLHRASRWSPRRINLQLGRHDTAPGPAADCWIRILALAESLGLHVDLEIHRATATETPEKAAEIAERVHDATGRWPRFSLDFSHHAVVKHVAVPFARTLLPRPELLALVRQMHVRPFNGHHAQVPVSGRSGGLTPEARDYFEFLETVLNAWRARNDGGEILWLCPENGPPDGGYALSCFPDVWEDAVRIRDEIQMMWSRRPAGAGVET